MRIILTIVWFVIALTFPLYGLRNQPTQASADFEYLQPIVVHCGRPVCRVSIAFSRLWIYEYVAPRWKPIARHNNPARTANDLKSIIPNIQVVLPLC